MPPNAELGRVVHNWLFSPLSYHTRLWPRGCEGTPLGAPSSCKACSLLGCFGRTSSKSRGGRPGPGRRVLDRGVEIALGACPVPGNTLRSLWFSFHSDLAQAHLRLLFFLHFLHLLLLSFPVPSSHPLCMPWPRCKLLSAEGTPQSQEEVIQDSPHGAQ